MKKAIIALSLFAIAALPFKAQAQDAKLATASDTLSYKFAQMYGYGVSQELKSMPNKVNKEEFLKGMNSILNDTANSSYAQGTQMAASLINTFKQVAAREKVNLDMNIFKEEFTKAFLDENGGDPRAIQKEVMPLMKRVSQYNKENDPVALANKQAEKDFFAKIKKKDKKAKPTKSGLYYTVINAGNGTQFTEKDQIMVNYKGTHLDGTEFDSNGDKPVKMSPSSVIPGFREGMLMMKPGAKYKFYIPSELAYGLNGAGDKIKANEALIFELETIGLAPEKPKAEKTATKDEKTVVAPAQK